MTRAKAAETARQQKMPRGPKAAERLFAPD
jgi:hypothetical protein